MSKYYFLIISIVCCLFMGAGFHAHAEGINHSNPAAPAPKNISVAQALAALPSVPIPTIQGTVWYVSALTGNDANKGTSSTSAFKTLRRATDTGYNTKYKGGDVVVVMPGTYNESVRMTVSGTSQAYSILMAMPDQPRPVIVGNLTAQYGSCFGCGTVDVWASYVRISGLDVSAPDPKMDGSAINAGYQPIRDSNGVFRPRFHHFIIDHNFVHDSSCAGIAVEGSDYSVVSYNIAYNNANTAPNQCSGISVGYSVDHDLLDGYHNQIINNITFNNKVLVPAYYPPTFVCPKSKPTCHTDGNGIIIDDNRRTQRQDKSPYMSKSLVFGNISFSNGGRGFEVFSSDNIDIFNNTSYHNGNDSMLENYPFDNSEISISKARKINIYNNIFASLGKDNPTIWQQSATDVALKNNITFGGNIYIDNKTAASLDESNRIADPLFSKKYTDNGTENFSIANDSPAFSSGHPLPISLVDLSGNTISANSIINIGAYVK